MSTETASPARPLPAPGSLGAWVLAARPRTLVAGWAPVLVASVALLAASADIPERFSFHVDRAVAALIVALAIQVGTNLVNDAADHARGADGDDRLGPPRAVATGVLSARAVRFGAIACFVVAAAAGLWLASVSSWWLLVPGAAALIAGVGYTAGPKPLAYVGLGEVFVFLFFGLFASVGTVLVQLPVDAWADPGNWAFAAMLGVSFGLLSVAILEVNNIRDAPTDRLVGKRTLAVAIGDRWARLLYRWSLWGSLGWLFVAFAPALAFPALVPFLCALPFAIRADRVVRSGTAGRELNQALGATAATATAVALSTCGLLLIAVWLIG